MGILVDPRLDLRDPPIFLLQANPAWNPALGDGSWQRVPVGTSGQVLTVNADGSVGWANASGGFTSPMTTTGDMIYSNPGATPVRLPIGTAGFVLTSSAGLPVWAASQGFANPMTTPQDLIVGGTAGAATRFPIGSNGQVLTVSAGAVTWANSAAGFANPMTTLGDVITAAGGGTAQRLAVGGNSQVLTVVSGQPAWANSPAGFGNPMTSTGDIIYSSSNTGTPARLGIGSANQVLTVVGGVPAWAAGGGGGGGTACPVVVFPSGDTTGVTDQANITATWTSGGLVNGGLLQLAPGKFYVKPTSGLNCLTPPAQTSTSPNNGGSPVCIQGTGNSTILFPVGAGVTGIFYHRSTTYGAQFGNPAQQQTGFIRDLTIDGTNTSGAAIGLDWGDGWGYDFNVAVVNFDTAGAIGVNQVNRHFWTEKNGPLYFNLSNNTTAYYATTALGAGGDHSSEYNEYHIKMFCNANQQGFVVDGVNMGGSHLWMYGNMSLSNGSGAAPPGNIAALSVINAAGVTGGDAHRWYEGSIWMKVEANPGNGTGTTYPFDVFSDGVGNIKQCSGGIHSSNLTNGNMNGAEFSFNGSISGDTALATAWPSTSFPGLGNIWQNTGPNALVCVAGGTVSGVSVGGNPTGLTSGAFYVVAGGSLTVNGTVAPTTFNVVPAAQVTY